MRLDPHPKSTAQLKSQHNTTFSQRNAPFITTHSELQKVLFLAPSVCGFLFLHEISTEPLNGFAPNSHRRRVWSLAWMSLKVKVKGQGHQEQKTAFFTISAACVWFMFGKTSLAFSYNCTFATCILLPY